MAFEPTPEMEQARKKILSDFYAAKEKEGYDDDNLYELLLEFEDKYMPDKLREAVKNHNESDVSDDLYEWGKWVYNGTPFESEYFNKSNKNGDSALGLIDKVAESKDNAISKDELYKMIQKWRNGSSEANSKSSKLQEAYLEYLDSILKKEGYDTFATDPDTGEELDDYTPEFEATQAEVMNDLGLGDDDIDLIFNGKGDFNDFETEYDDNGLPVKQSDKSHDNTNLGNIAKSITQNDLGRSL